MRVDHGERLARQHLELAGAGVLHPARHGHGAPARAEGARGGIGRQDRGRQERPHRYVEEPGRRQAAVARQQGESHGALDRARVGPDQHVSRERPVLAGAGRVVRVDHGERLARQHLELAGAGVLHPARHGHGAPARAEGARGGIGRQDLRRSRGGRCRQAAPGDHNRCAHQHHERRNAEDFGKRHLAYPRGRRTPDLEGSVKDGEIRAISCGPPPDGKAPFCRLHLADRVGDRHFRPGELLALFGRRCHISYPLTASRRA